MKPRLLAGLCCLLCAIAISTGSLAAATPPSADAGVLDLSRSDLSSAAIPLRGEWEFYWSRLLEPADFESEPRPEPDGYVHVPGAWNGYTFGGRTLDGRGYGTYRLIVRLPEGSTTGEGPARLALYIPWTFAAYKLWIDGSFAASNGTVGTSRNEMEPEFLPLTVPFNARRETVELVLQVSNFHHRNGGVWNSPLVGTYSLIARRQATREAIDTLLIGAILFMAIFHLVVYLWFRDRRAPLYLGITFLIVAVRTMVTSEHVLDQLFGGLPWELELRIEYLTGYFFLAALFGFLRSVFPNETPTWASMPAWIVSTLGASVTLFTPVYFSSLFIPYYILVLGLFMLASLVIFIVAALRRRDGARIIIWGGFAFAGALYHDLFHYNLMGLDMDLVPIGLFFFLLSQSLALGERFALTYHREIALAQENADLLKTVRAQLEEVRESRRIVAAADEELRKSLAERLHGRVQTRLLAVWHRLGMLKEALPQGAPAGGRIEEIRRDIDEIREVEIRQVSHLLHPSIVRVGLLPAVDSLVRQYEGAFNVRVQVDEQVRAWDNPANSAIPETVRLVAYRVLEDALGNVQAHAQARTATVRIAAGPGGRSVRIDVTDDGRGFNRAKLEPGLGLNAIAARVGTVGGTWDIESQPGAGTALTVELPICPESPESEVHDPATRLLSRRSFDSIAEAALEHAKGSKSPAGAVYVALVGVREAYEAAVPERVDEALRTIAEAVRRTIPAPATPCRYHEEAIAVLLPESEEAGARKAAEALEAELTRATADLPAPLAVKVGWAAYPADAVHARDLFERAARRAFKEPSQAM